MLGGGLILSCNLKGQGYCHPFQKILKDIHYTTKLTVETEALNLEFDPYTFIHYNEMCVCVCVCVCVYVCVCVCVLCDFVSVCVSQCLCVAVCQ